MPLDGQFWYLPKFSKVLCRKQTMIQYSISGTLLKTTGGCFTTFILWGRHQRPFEACPCCGKAAQAYLRRQPWPRTFLTLHKPSGSQWNTALGEADADGSVVSLGHCCMQGDDSESLRAEHSSCRPHWDHAYDLGSFPWLGNIDC